MQIVKANGERERYQRKKLYRTCRRTGAPSKACDRAIDVVERKLHEGMSTKRILKIMLRELRKYAPSYAAKYDIKRALMRLGPAGFNFETLTAELLQKHGYATTENAMLHGGCVEQEVDIIAIRDKRCHMIECKYHNAPGIYTGLKDTMYTWARFIDLNEGYEQGRCQKFHEPWLVTNTKFSHHAIQYAECRGVKLIGWDYPSKGNYLDLLQEKSLYPITTIRLHGRTLKALADGHIMFLRDLCELPEKEIRERTGIKGSTLKRLKKRARTILE